MKRDKLAQEYGGRLKELRLLKNLSQEELAKKVGLSSAAILKIEKGRSFPQPLTRRKLATFFGADDMLNKHQIAEKTSPYPTLHSHTQKDVEGFDVIQGGPGVTIYIRPDISMEQRKLITEMAMEMRKRLKKLKTGEQK